MQKKSLEICCYVCGAGAFGVFFRWLQDQMAFDDAGLAEKSVFNYLVPLLNVASALLFHRFIEQAQNEKLYIPTDFCQALKNEGRLFTFFRWVSGGLMIIGGLLLISSCETDKDAELLFILAFIAIACVLSYPLLLGSANDKYGKLRHPTLACFGAFLPILLFAFWLVISYKKNALNSVIWSYLIEMATMTVAMLAFFRAAGFAFGAAKTWRSFFTIMLGAVMCIMSLADERNMGMQIILLSAAVQLVLYVWILIMNMQKKIPKPKEEKPPEDGFERLR